MSCSKRNLYQRIKSEMKNGVIIHYDNGKTYTILCRDCFNILKLDLNDKKDSYTILDSRIDDYEKKMVCENCLEVIIDYEE